MKSLPYSHAAGACVTPDLLTAPAPVALPAGASPDAALPDGGHASRVGTISGVNDACFVAPPVSGDTVRVLVAVDVPAEALTVIQVRWAIVAHAQQSAPALALEFAQRGLQELAEHIVNVSGVAAVEPIENPLARWVRRAA